MRKRRIYGNILSEKSSKKASIIIGPRQVGKTTVLRALHQELGGVMFDVDIFSEYSKVSTYERCLATLQSLGYQENQSETFFVFFDEFQRYSDLSMVIKSLYDHHENIKVYATGSSSLAIKDAVQESLAGRKMITHMWPLDFEEFLEFKEKRDIWEKLVRLKGVEIDDYFAIVPEARELLEEFLVFGGYPEVALSNDAEEKREILRSIFDLYIKKDFAEYARPEKLKNAERLMNVLAINNGQMINFAKLAQISELAMQTVKNYISILEETFIIATVRPYFSNKNKEVSKMSKVYFSDPGVRNYFGGGFESLQNRVDAGFLFETFVVSEILKSGMEQRSMKYYRTKTGEEIDIVLERDNKPLLPIEVKFQKAIRSRDVAAISRFVEAHNLPKGIIVTAGEMHKLSGTIAATSCFGNFWND